MDTIRAIIFDLDGVICFTDNYHYQAWKELADAEGIYFDEKINGRLRGVSRMESLDIILERASRCYIRRARSVSGRLTYEPEHSCDRSVPEINRIPVPRVEDLLRRQEIS